VNKWDPHEEQWTQILNFFGVPFEFNGFLSIAVQAPAIYAFRRLSERRQPPSSPSPRVLVYSTTVFNDFDGDGVTDVAVWRRPDGYWHVIGSATGTSTSTQWGGGHAPYNDVPIPGDYDGDGRTDVAVWRPSTGVWHIITSSNGTAVAVQWGAGYAPYDDVPVPSASLPHAAQMRPPVP
jgi:hypothetical protein